MRNSYFAKKFTQALNKWKQENGYTQDDLSKITGIHRNSITKYKKGEAYPTPETMDVICSIFGVCEDYFLPHDEVKIEYRQKSLSDYTTKELLAEIERRCGA